MINELKIGPTNVLVYYSYKWLFVKALIRSCEIEFFPWSCVNFLHNLSYLLLTDVRKASILWNVLPNEPIYILALIQFSHEQHIGASLSECDNCSMPILSYYCVHLEVSETPAVSFCRTFTYADTIRYRYSFASNRPSTVLQLMTAVLV